MSAPAGPVEWKARAETLLDTYLSRIGITSAPVRERWTHQVMIELEARSASVAAEDLVEEAVERLLDLIERRLAVIGRLDPLRDRSQIAGTLVALLNEKHREVTNQLLDRSESGDDSEELDRLRYACAASAPEPVPDDAPLAMPVQSIELRSWNPLRLLFGRRR